MNLVTKIDVVSGLSIVRPMTAEEEVELPGPDVEIPATPREQIDRLERQHMLPRVVREVLLKVAEKEATELGVPPESNPGYVRLKAFDGQIAVLRRQL